MTIVTALEVQADAPDDAALWAQVLAGDHRAFHALYRRHCRLVHTVARRLGLGEPDAEDLVAEVFLTAWRTRSRIEVGAAGMAPWLVTVAANQSRKHHRARASRSRMERRITQWRHVASEDHADAVVDGDERARQMAAAAAALRLLSKRDQELIATCVLAGLRPVDVAAAESVPAATIRSQLLRARRRLQAHYESIVASQEGASDE